jgi:cysteinyl-tRNA synthetase
MKDLMLYDTLQRRKLRFVPLRSGSVGIYSCGPTVYAAPHLGNMRPYVFADVLKRTLLRFGYRVRHVINVTDVGHLTDDADLGEDKVERAAQSSGTSAWEVALRYTRAFQQDIERLNVLAPDVLCRATDHVPEQIEMIERLERLGFTYALDDGLYFDTARDPEYGKLGRLPVSDASASRIAGAGHKRQARDFCLWKRSPASGPKRQMEWPSPWGVGFPGWHIECSAMSTKYLGERFDIHTGGVDHIPVHHTNEIAQSENALGVRPWVSYWLHGGWLTLEGAKLAKSSGASLSIDTLVAERVDPLAFRLFLLGAHYRHPLAFTEQALSGAATAYSRLHALVETCVRAQSAGASDGAVRTELVGTFLERFDAALGDDLNTARALSVVWEALDGNALAPAEKLALAREFDGVLGLGLLSERPIFELELGPEIEALIRGREAARQAKDYARADAIRSKLEALGVKLEDTGAGTRFRT